MRGLPAVLVWVLIAAGCGKKEPPPAPPPPPAPAPTQPASKSKKAPPDPAEMQRRKDEILVKAGLKAPAVPEPTTPRKPPPPDPVVPILGLSANGSDVAELPSGWPLVLRLRAHARPGAVLPEDWAKKATMESPVAVKAGTLEGNPAWTVSAADLDGLPRGPLVFTARIEGLRATARVTLVPAPKQAPAGGDPRLLVAKVDAWLAAGEKDEAMAQVDGALQKTPDDPAALSLRARLLEASGRREEALLAYAKAIDAAKRRRQPAADALRRSRERLEAAPPPPK